MKDPYAVCSKKEDCLCNKCVWEAGAKFNIDQAKLLHKQWKRQVEEMTDNV